MSDPDDDSPETCEPLDFGNEEFMSDTDDESWPDSDEEDS